MDMLVSREEIICAGRSCGKVIENGAAAYKVSIFNRIPLPEYIQDVKIYHKNCTPTEELADKVFLMMPVTVVYQK